MLWMPFLYPLQAQKKELTSSNKKAVQAYEKGLQALNTRQYKNAVSFFEQALKKDKDFAEAYLKMGNAYRQVGDRLQAHTLFE
ncbi:MAG: tetratricopeptide repeat protein, partial [Chitinophagaceae bacterium]